MRVYDVIKTTEDTYISETSRLIYPGMCWCLKVSAVQAEPEIKIGRVRDALSC